MPQPHDTDFDLIAPFYEGLSRLVYGSALRRAQRAHLDLIPAQASVLLIGGGSGWLLGQVLQCRPQATVTYLEASSRMLQLAKERLARYPKEAQAGVTFLHGTEDSLSLTDPFDVIITPFLLDLFPDGRLQHLMDRLYLTLAPGGLWLFSDFWPVRRPAPWWQRLLLTAMYTFFGRLSSVRATTLPDFERHFSRYGLKLLEAKAFYSGMVQARAFRKG